MGNATIRSHDPLDERLTLLRGFVNVTWRGRRIVLVSVLATTIIGICAAFLPHPVYKATVTLAPAQQQGAGTGLSALVGQFGGLDLPVGLSEGARDERDAYAILGSRAFSESFIRDNSLLPIMFAHKWDPEHKRWKSNKPDYEPTMDDAWELFDKRIRLLVQDQKTGIVSLSIRWRDRQLAAEWANELATRINTEMRRRVNAEADASLTILQDELTTISAVELRQAIFKLSEAQLRRKIFANSRPDFVFAIIDPATVPDARRFDSPKRTLVISFSVIIGLLIGIAWSSVRDAFSARRLGADPQRAQRS